MKNYLLIFVYDYLQKKYYINNKLLNYFNSQNGLNKEILTKHYFINYYSYEALVVSIIVTWSFILLLISFLRTSFSDPGYLPDPVKYEYSLIISKTVNEKKNHLILQLRKSLANGPLNESELQNYKKKINCICDCYSTKDDNTTLYQNNSFSSSSNDNIPAASVTKEKISQNNDVMSPIVLCPTCLRLKVERCHHCKQCNKCVQKMDHHCPWLANCVGANNYKYFLLTIIYGFITSTIVLFTFWEYIYKIMLIEDISLLFCIYNLFIYICNMILWMFNFYLIWNNWINVINNLTTIEKADFIRFNELNKYSIDFYSKYDKGKMQNIKEIFGLNILFWFIPY